MNPQQPDQDSAQNQPQPANHRPAGPSRPSRGSPRHLKALLALLLGLLVAAGAAWFFMSTDMLVEETGEDNPQVEVAITEEGFAPETILINPGTTVTWINRDDGPHRVASNPHPEHDALPGFDAGDPIFPDESYSYTFTEAGEFDYHDHLNPETNGTIVVEE